jgi:hypothetical protein
MQNAGVEINPDVGSLPPPEAIVLTTLLGFHEDDARRKMRPFLNIQIPSVLPMCHWHLQSAFANRMSLVSVSESCHLLAVNSLA